MERDLAAARVRHQHADSTRVEAAKKAIVEGREPEEVGEVAQTSTDLGRAEDRATLARRALAAIVEEVTKLDRAMRIAGAKGF